MSFSGADRDAGTRLGRELRSLGLQVFLDADTIDHFAGISKTIQAAIESSRTLVAYYSKSYASRPACQLELAAVFLAGMRTGDPCGRIIVVNPEPGFDHLQPAQLADARYAQASADASDVAELAALIDRRVRQLTGVIGDVSFTSRPRWFAEWIPGAIDFVGRYSELWRLHSALHAVDVPLTKEPECAPVVAVTGMPGIGKSSLLAAYAWLFGAAFAGGIFRISLSGARTTNKALQRYASELRRVAASLGIRVDGVPHRSVVAQLAAHLARQESPCLWIVDDVPAGFDARQCHQLVPPAGTHLRAALISEEAIFDSVLPVVEVGPLDEEHARRILLRDHLPAGSEADIVDRLVRRLGGHPGMLVATNRHLNDLHGFVSHQHYLQEVEEGGAMTDVLEPVARRLGDVEALLLRLSAVCGGNGMPAVFIAEVVSSLLAGDAGLDTTRAALTRLRRRMLAQRNGTLWNMAQPAVDAARRHRRPIRTEGEMAAAAAATAIRLASDHRLNGDELQAICDIASALSRRRDLSRRHEQALLELLVNPSGPGWWRRIVRRLSLIKGNAGRRVRTAMGGNSVGSVMRSVAPFAGGERKDVHRARR